MTTQKTIGLHADVAFISFNNTIVSGKVDTGATTSSLHATDIQSSHGGKMVAFRSPVLAETGDRMFNIPCVGIQHVSSADGGTTTRAVVKLDVSINGTILHNVEFNLNDRSNMDAMVLIGENILTAGEFIIDPSKDGSDDVPPQPTPITEEAVLGAVTTLVDAGLSIADLARLINTVTALRAE